MDESTPLCDIAQASTRYGHDRRRGIAGATGHAVVRAAQLEGRGRRVLGPIWRAPGASGIALFAGGVGILHLLRPDLDPGRRTISEYAIGPYGSVMTVSFLALGAGVLGLTVALARDGGLGRRGRLALVLLGGFAAGSVVCGVFPTDLTIPGATVTRTGQIHNRAATASFLCGFATLPAAAWAFRAESGWRPLALPTLGATLLCAAELVIGGGAGYFGWAERLFVGTLLAWQYVVARRLHAAADRS